MERPPNHEDEESWIPSNVLHEILYEDSWSSTATVNGVITGCLSQGPDPKQWEVYPNKANTQNLPTQENAVSVGERGYDERDMDEFFGDQERWN